jgi:hypothetical protein
LTDNQYDELQGEGSCDSIMAAGIYDCESVVAEASGDEDAVTFFEVCLRSCHVNYYDSVYGVGECHNLIGNLITISCGSEDALMGSNGQCEYMHSVQNFLSLSR